MPASHSGKQHLPWPPTPQLPMSHHCYCRQGGRLRLCAASHVVGAAGGTAGRRSGIWLCLIPSPDILEDQGSGQARTRDEQRPGCEETWLWSQHPPSPTDSGGVLPLLWASVPQADTGSGPVSVLS